MPLPFQLLLDPIDTIRIFNPAGDRIDYYSNLHQSAPDLRGGICKEESRNTKIMFMTRMSDVSMNPSFNNRVDCTGSVRIISYRQGFREST